ncbi:MAG: hypothetical protein AAGF44_13305, partial [Pseudomonadota bacterium]
AGFMDFLSVNAMSIIQLVTLALVALMLGLFVIRPILNVDPPAPELGVDGDPTLIDGTASTIDASIAQAGEVIDAETVDEDRLSNLREAVLDQPEEAVRLLRNWLDDMPEQEEKAA